MRFIFLLFIAAVMTACSGQQQPTRQKAQAYLNAYTGEWQQLAYASSKAEWRSNTYIVDGDTATDNQTRRAGEALAAFTGSKANIDSAKKYLVMKEQLTAIQVKQLEMILYKAANNPATVAELVKARIAAETDQNSRLFGYQFSIADRPVSKNEINTALKNETRIDRRREYWEASQEVGKGLKAGMSQLRDLRNQTVQALGYSDYFSYQVSEYGMTTDEMIALNQQIVKEVWPLYRELHTYARYELAEEYGVKQVPEMLPAHWLPNQWGQDWNAMVTVEGFDLDGALAERSGEWIVRQGEDFFVSMGFEKLPAIFYDKSSLYPLPAGTPFKKNNHASAWHMDLERDVRSLMSVIPDADWYETVHHELGHIYYYLCYTRPEVPPLLREGANRATHEAIGSMLGLAAMQKPFLQARGLLDDNVQTDEMRILLKQALNYIVFLPWSAGVMTHFEKDLYAEGLPESTFNEKWWQLKRQYQGIVPPEKRGEMYCDAASKTHITNDAAQYYDYALSSVQFFQIHQHIATRILKQNPRATNYYGNREVGDFLAEFLSKGASEDWRQLMKETVGGEISAKAMLEYFAPLMDYLEEANEGRQHTI